MNFIAPEFLYFLGFLAIPILIHLFNFRRYKTVKFSQVRFLKSIKKQTQSTSKLKHLLVLISRCLAISALVIAFAQPFLIDDNENNTIGKKGVIIYLDNSFSMQAGTEIGTLLDLAKIKAQAILDAYSEVDKFQLHTNEFNGKQERWLNKESFINALQNVSFSPVYRSTKQVLSRLNQQSKDNEFILNVYIISDLQKINTNFEEISDSSSYTVIPVQSSVSENSWISALSSYQPFHLEKQNEELNAVIKTSNIADAKSYNGSLVLNDQLKSPFSFEISKDSIEKKINYLNADGSYLTGHLSIKDYPVTFDDTFYFSYSMQRPIEVLHIYEENSNNSIQTLYESDSLIKYYSSSIKQIDFGRLEKSSFVILEGIKSFSSGVKDELSKFINKGGSIAIFPSSDMDINSINSFLNVFQAGSYSKLVKDTLDVTQINHEAELFENVFEEKPKRLNLPKVNSYWKIQTPQNSIQQNILSYRNGDAFLNAYSLNNASVYLSSIDLESNQSNFNKHALFVPILFNMALQSVNPKPLAYQLGKATIVLNNLERKEKAIRLVKNGKEIIPKQQYINNSLEISIGNEIQEAGHYQIMQDNEILQYVSFNHNRNESELSIYDLEEFMDNATLSGLNIKILDDNTELLSKSILDQHQGKKLWKHFVVLALLFLGLEILLLRILK